MGARIRLSPLNETLAPRRCSAECSLACRAKATSDFLERNPGMPGPSCLDRGLYHADTRVGVVGACRACVAHASPSHNLLQLATCIPRISHCWTWQTLQCVLRRSLLIKLQ